MPSKRHCSRRASYLLKLGLSSKRPPDILGPGLPSISSSRVPIPSLVDDMKSLDVGPGMEARPFETPPMRW